MIEKWSLLANGRTTVQIYYGGKTVVKGYSAGTSAEMQKMF